MKKSLNLFGLLAIVALCVSVANAEDNGYYNGDYGRTSLPPGAQRQQSGGGVGFNVGAKLAFWKQRTKAAPDSNCCGNETASNYTDQGREEFQRPAPVGVILDDSLPIGVVTSPAPEPDPGLQGNPVHQRTGSCGGKGKICFVPETHTVRVPAVTCVEKGVCWPQVCFGPCGVSARMIPIGTVKLPAVTCVDKEVTTYRKVREPCQCNKCNGN